jgi:predicted nucleic acid-binding protein
MATSTARSASTGRFMTASRESRQASPIPSSPRRYLIDNSVWARLSTDPIVVAALKSVVDLAHPDDVLICAPIALEVGFSARTGEDHSRITKQLAAFAECSRHPTADEVLHVQNKLWRAGLVRAAGAVDCLIAAYAMKNVATLLHYDRDFEHIATVVPELRHQWIVPRGSID